MILNGADDKAFDLIVERLEERVSLPNMERMEERVGKRQTIGFGFGVRYAVGIVNQVAEEYGKDNNVPSNEITSLDEVINRLQYKADNIKAKLEPSYFTECIDYLKSLPRCDDGWIPCSERLPDKEGTYLVTLKSFKTITFADFKDVKHNPHFNANKVIAWQPLPQPYVNEK